MGAIRTILFSAGCLLLAGMLDFSAWAHQKAPEMAGAVCYREIPVFIDSAFAVDPKQGIRLLESKLSGWERCLPAQDTALGNVYHKIGVLCYITDQYEAAIRWFLKAFQIRDIHPQWQTEALLNTLNGLTQSSLLLFDYPRAKTYIDKQIALIHAQKYTNREVEADIYFADGQLAYRQEDYVRCREKLMLAADLYRLHTPDNPNLGHVLNLLGVSSDLLKAYKEAFDWYRQAIRVFQINQLTADAARSLHNIGISYQKIQMPDSALYYFEQSNAVHRVHRDTLEIARNFVEMSKVYFQGNHLTAAFRLAEQSFSLRKQLLQEWHPDVLESNILLGQWYAAQGMEDKAMQRFDNAISAAAGSPRSDQVIPPLAEKAGLLARKKDMNAALNAHSIYLKLDSLIHQSRLKFQQESSQIAFNQTLRHWYESAVTNALWLFKATGQADYFNTALAFCERNKAFVLQSQLRKRAVQGFAGIPDSVLQREVQLELQVNAQYELLQASDRMPDSVKIALRRTADRANAAQEEYDQYLAGAYPEYYALIRDPAPARTVSELQKSLSTETLLLEFFAGDSTLTILAVGKAHFDAWQWNSMLAVNEQIRQILRMTEAPHAYPAAAYCHLARDLYLQILEKPLNRFSSFDIRRLQIVPDGFLALLPFDILLTSDYQRLDDQTPYLLKRYSHCLLFNNRMARNSSSARWHFKRRSNAVFAIDYRDDPALFMTGSTPATGAPPAALDYAGQEMEEVAAVIGGSMYQNREATTDRFLQEINRSPIVHLTAHGVYNTDQPMLSGILFSKSSPDEEGTGLLTAARIYGIRTAASFIFLSACQTGAGQVIDGEGVMSIARAFTYAGIRSQAMTLWSVSDRATGQLAAHFYRHLKSGKAKDEALRLAKLDYLSSATTSVGKHPAFWAGVVIFGNTEPLFQQRYWIWIGMACIGWFLWLLIKRMR